MAQITAWTGPLTDRSGTVGTLGSSQLVCPVNLSRHYLLVQNPVGSGGPITINFGLAAQSSGAGGSVVIAAGTAFVMQDVFVSTDAVFINAGTSGQLFVAKEG